MKKLESIWVLYGGSSSEREVSLRTGKGVFEALKAKGYRVELFDVRPGESIQSLDWKKSPDMVFIGLHGTFGEDGIIQGFLEAQKIKYVGSDSQSSSLCFNKGLTKKMLRTFDISTPEGFDVQGMEGFKRLESSSAFPQDFYKRDWFIKPAREGSTVGIERFEAHQNREDFLKALNKALDFDSYIIIEEWVRGPEITVPVLHGKALPAVEIRPLSEFFDYESKYTKGKTEYFCPANIAPEMEKRAAEMAVRTYEVLECCDYGRVDIMISKKGPTVLEMNTLPGMTETSLVPKSAKVAGLGYGDFLQKLVEGSWERQNK